MQTCIKTLFLMNDLERNFSVIMLIIKKSKKTLAIISIKLKDCIIKNIIKVKMKKLLLLGDEAFAQGALDAGISGAYGYPGTPSTEIIEYIQKNPLAVERNIHREWSTNEKQLWKVLWECLMQAKVNCNNETCWS